MKIGLIQTKQNANYDFHSQGIYETVEEAIENQHEMVERTLCLVQKAGELGCDLVVTPEAMNFPGLKRFHGGELREMVPDMEALVWKRFGEVAEKGGFWLVAGAYTKREHCYNSALIFRPDGKLWHIYDKIHASVDEGITAGSEYCVFQLPEGKVGVCICWDMQFPETARELVLRGAKLIAVPTWGWEHIYAGARAYENGVFVAAAMGVPYDKPIGGRRAPSQVIGPDGAVLAEAPLDGDYVLTCEIDLSETDRFQKIRLGGRRPDTYTRIAINESE